MAESSEKQGDKVPDTRMGVNLGVSLSGEAKGSQTVLLALGVSATIFALIGLAATSVGLYSSMILLSIVGILPFGIGCFGWWKCLELWSKSQPSLDAPHNPPLPGSISFKRSSESTEIAISGTDSLVLQENSQNFMLAMLHRYFSQQPLPPPAGQVTGSPANEQSLRKYSDSEIEQINKQFTAALSDSRNHLGDLIRQMRIQESSSYDGSSLALAVPNHDIVVGNEGQSELVDNSAGKLNEPNTSFSKSEEQAIKSDL